MRRSGGVVSGPSAPDLGYLAAFCVVSRFGAAKRALDGLQVCKNVVLRVIRHRRRYALLLTPSESVGDARFCASELYKMFIKRGAHQYLSVSDICAPFGYPEPSVRLEAKCRAFGYVLQRLRSDLAPYGPSDLKIVDLRRFFASNRALYGFLSA